MSTMQYEQPHGFAPAGYQYSNQDSGTVPQAQDISSPPSMMNIVPQTYQPANYVYDLSSRPQAAHDRGQAPPIPPRHESRIGDGIAHIHQYQQPQSPYEQTPPIPQRNQKRSYFAAPNTNYETQPPRTGPVGGFGGYQSSNCSGYMPPPQRFDNPFEPGDDPADPVHYTRDPHKLVAYLVPFPKPRIEGIDPSTIPARFLIYTPPPPPLTAPKEGEKEAKLHKVQRKWQQEVRSAKTSNAKVASWQGVKSRATKAIAWGVNQTTTSNLEFLGRVNDDNTSEAKAGTSSDSSGASTTKKTVGVSEMVLVYPPSMGLDDQQMRAEFVNTMLRTKSKAQRDSIIATGLLPISFGIDIMATLIWPFGGLGEIDSVWLYSSLRGAKTAHSVTKRLSSSSPSGDLNDTLQLSFTPSSRLATLQRYLEAECHRTDPARFPTYRSPPTESEVLEAIGWSPSQTGGQATNWEDEQWEMSEVKDDVRSNMHKGAKEWKKFCVAFAKEPEKAVKK